MSDKSDIYNNIVQKVDEAGSVSAAFNNHDYGDTFGADYSQAHNYPFYNTQAFDTNYAQYLKMIENYKGNPELYQRLLELYQWQAYEPGFWEGFMGDKSGWQDFYNQLHMTNMNAAQNLIDEYNQREYNSAESQVARERAAGLNPDLNGGQNITPGEAGDATPATEPTPLIPHGNDAAQGAIQVFDFAKDIVTSVVGMYDMIKGLGIKDAAIALNDLEIDDKAYDIALKQESGKIGPRRMFYKKEDGSYDWEKMASDFFVQPVTKKGRGSRATRALSSARNKLYYTEDGQQYISPALQNAILAMDKNISDNAVGYAKNVSEPGYDPQGITEWAAMLGQTQTKWRLDTMKFDSLCREWEYKVKKASQPGIAAESNYKADLYGVADENGQTLGQVEGKDRMDDAKTRMLIRQGEKIKAEYNKWLEDSRRSLYSKVYGQGHWYGKLGTMFLPGVLDSFDTMSGRFLDHIDGLLDTLLNPAAKVLGGALGNVVK